MADWYYTINAVQHGPVGDDEIRAMLASRVIGPETLVWADGMADWQPLGTHPVWVVELGGQAGAAVMPLGVGPVTNGMAIASLVCGILSIFGMAACFMGILTGIPAVICGHLALKQIRNQPFQKGRAGAIAGLVTGYLAILVSLVAIGVMAFVVISEGQL